MNPGDVVRLKYLRSTTEDGVGWMDIKAPKGKVLICMYIGMEPSAMTDGKRVDHLRVLYELGFVPDPEMDLDAETVARVEELRREYVTTKE